MLGESGLPSRRRCLRNRPIPRRGVAGRRTGERCGDAGSFLVTGVGEIAAASGLGEKNAIESALSPSRSSGLVSTVRLAGDAILNLSGMLIRARLPHRTATDAFQF